VPRIITAGAYVRQFKLLGMGWMVWGSNPGAGEGANDFLSCTPIQTCPIVPTAFCTTDTCTFPRGKSGWGVAFTTHPHLAPRLRMSGAIPLLYL